jgi:site-specific DNA recombinase
MGDTRSIKPKPPFKPVFQVAASRNGSEIRILNESLNGSSIFLVETGKVGKIHEVTLFSEILLKDPGRIF